MEAKMEIERRFLLKKLPDVSACKGTPLAYTGNEPREVWSNYKRPMPDKFLGDDVIIENWYGADKSRYRSISFKNWDGKIDFAYYLIKGGKKKISPGVYEENEVAISAAEFYEATAKGNMPHITKRRYIHKDGDLKWEIDHFWRNGMALIIAEVELPNIDYPLVIPDYIQDVLLLEVTSIDKFLNSNLAK
jgi:CYTH domain-containing protein